MSKFIVRCRCGHQVLGREVLRTQACEKPSGAESIYVKFRCRRCKKIGESFIPHDEWNPAIFEVPHDEMKVEERDRFIGAQAIASGDVISFHRALQATDSIDELLRVAPTKTETRRKSESKAEARGAKDGARDGDKSAGDKAQNDKPPRSFRSGK